MKKKWFNDERVYRPLFKWIRVMKLTLFFLLAALMHVSASVYSQQTKLSVSMRDATVKEVLKQIEEQSEFFFLYKSIDIDVNRIVSVDIKEKSVEILLDQIFNGTTIAYEVVNRQIVLTDKAKENPLPEAQQPKKAISGKVTDSSGATLPGVSVVVIGTNNGVITDNEGNYSIANFPENAILQFSFVGMKSQNIVIGKNATLNVILSDENFGMDEVVVVGYGVMKKSDLTGSVTSLKSDQIMLGMAQSPDAVLRGKSAGVQISSVSGQPGSGASVRIRGNNSILASNEPLYVVDGIPLDGGGAASGIAGVSASPLTIVNPADIESIEILKDASATAIYGSRGANGVVLITTTRGKKGMSNANFNVSYGWQTVANPIKLTTPEEWATMWNESMDYTNNGNGKFDLANLPARTDWMAQLFKAAPTQSYDLSFNGGTDKLTYMISGGFTDQQGIIVNTDFKRYSLRSNVENIFSKWLTIGANISATRTIGNQAGQGDMDSDSPVARIALSSPLVPIFKADGTYNLYGDFEGYRPNAYASLYEQTNQDTRNRLISSIYAGITLFKDLKFKSSLATDVANSKSNYYLPSYIAEGLPYKGLAAIGTQNTLYWNSTNTLSYFNQLNDKHAFTAVLGVEWQKSVTEATYLRGSGFTNDIPTFNNISEASSFLGSSGYADWQMLSYISRLNYSFKNRYSLTFTGRIDGSSRFGANNKYATFPSAAFAWRAKEEEFFKRISSLSNLKFRMSYGTSGEQGIPIYQTFSTLGPKQVYIGQNSLIGYFPGRPANPSLKWEVTKQANTGMDLGLWGGRLNATLDLYYKKTTDLLYYRPLPPSSGYSSVLQNIGAIENKGIEFAFDVVAIDKGKFKWNINVNNSWNRNKLLELGDGRLEIINPEGGVSGGGLKNRPSILRVGMPLGILYGYISEGVIYDQAESLIARDKGMLQYAPGELKIKDISGPNGMPDGKITTYDKTIIGNANPDFTGGMTNILSYKGFQLSILSSWSYGNDILNYQHLANQLMKAAGNNATKQWFDTHWTIDRPSRTEPRSGYDVRAYPDVSYHIFDGSYFKINNISLSYALPRRIVTSCKLQTVRLTASVDNVYTFTSYPGWSPDLSIYANNVMAQGIDVAAYPLPRTINFGILIGF